MHHPAPGLVIRMEGDSEPGPSDANNALLSAWKEAEHILPLDDVVRKELWDGSIPIRLSLAQEDVSTFESPLPFYIQTSRMGYLSLDLAPARAYFQPYATSLAGATDEDMWVEYDSVPLKWHIPTGVLHDLLAPNAELPWALKLHLSGYPEKKLLPYGGEASVKRQFRQTLKQAASMRYGSAKRVSNLSLPEMEQLWGSIREGDFARFREISTEILKPSQPGPQGLASIKRIPIRVMLPHLQSPIQYPFNAFKPDGSLQTLTDLLQQLFPRWPDLSVGASADASGDAAGVSEADAVERNVIVQGISPPHHTPLLWLSQQLSHPDSVLYICITPS